MTVLERRLRRRQAQKSVVAARHGAKHSSRQAAVAAAAKSLGRRRWLPRASLPQGVVAVLPVSKKKELYQRRRQQQQLFATIADEDGDTIMNGVPLPLNPFTVAMMQCHVRHLQQDSNDRCAGLTLGQVVTALATSRDVLNAYCTDLWNNNNNDNIWESKQRLYQRRYQWVVTWQRLGKTLRSKNKQQRREYHWQSPVTEWGQVQQACAGYWEFPSQKQQEETSTLKQRQQQRQSSSSALDTYLQRLHQINETAPATSQLNSQQLWKRLAAHASSHVVIRTKQQDHDEKKQAATVSNTATATATAFAHDKADQFWHQAWQAAAEHRRQRLASTTALRTSQERWDRAQQAASMENLLRPLAADEQAAVNDILQSRWASPADVVAKLDTDVVTIQNMQTLRPNCWLSDEVIHFFLAMLAQRDEALCAEDPKRRRCHYFKSFFMTKLLNQGHASMAGVYEYRNVKRWSKKVPGKDIFALDKIVFPINVNESHWVCAVAFMQDKRIQFYDSMGDPGIEFLDAIFRYIRDEHVDKKKAPLPDADQWQLVSCTDDTPQQQNLVDCGVFTCMFADFLTKDCPLLFGQEHIDMCRDRIALSILQGKAIM